MCSLQQLEQLMLDSFIQQVPSLLIYGWCQMKLTLYSGKESPRKMEEKLLFFSLFFFFFKELLKV